MKATCILHDPVAGVVRLAETTVREPGAGELLMETEFTCISPGTELRCLAGKESGQQMTPFVPGYAMAGRVIKTGPGVKIPVGSRIAAGGTRDAGEFKTQWGAHISHALLSDGATMAVPDNVSLLDAVGARLVAIPYHGLLVAKPQPGETVAVIGLGVIGLGAAKLYAVHGARVIAIDRSEARVERARKWEIEAVASSEPASKTIKDRFPKGVDIVVDATGVPAVVADALKGIRELPWDDLPASPARYLVQGSYEQGVTIPYVPAFWGEVSILFPRACQSSDIRGVIGLSAAGRIDLSPIVADVRSPKDAPAAYQELGDPRSAPLTIAFNWK